MNFWSLVSKTCFCLCYLYGAYIKYFFLGNQPMMLRNQEVIGGHRLLELQDHPPVLGLGLPMRHPGAAADNGKAVCILQMVDATFAGLCATIGNKL